jgi:thiamine biosynthesis lipoprotein ApbE
VAVEDPRGREQPALRLSLGEGALATSSVTAPTWGPCRHQVIDPRTSRPYAGPVLQATVWAPTCAEAGILAKWALLGGPQVLDLVRGVMVLRDGRVVTNLHPPEPGGLAMVP